MNSFSKELTLNGLPFNIHKNKEDKKIRDNKRDYTPALIIKTNIEMPSKVHSVPRKTTVIITARLHLPRSTISYKRRQSSLKYPK